MNSGQRAISFIPVACEHFPLLRKWMTLPHMREWWGEPEPGLGYIRDMVEGRDTTRPFLIAVNGTPVGYIQYWFIGHHQNQEWLNDHPWLAELSADAIGIDLSIGEPEWLSIGVGSAALSQFVSKLRAEGHQTIVIDPDKKNARAIRAYTKAGFKPVPQLAEKTGNELIMQHVELEVAA